MRKSGCGGRASSMVWREESERVGSGEEGGRDPEG